MKKLDAEKKVDFILSNAIKEHGIETPPVNFTDRTMLKIKEVEILSSTRVTTALGLRFKIILWSIVSFYLGLIFAPFLPNINIKSTSPSGNLQLLDEFSFQLPKLIAMETSLYIMIATLGFVLVLLIDFFYTKKLVHVRS